METFDLDKDGLLKLKETIRVKYPKRLRAAVVKAVNEVCDVGLKGNYPETQKRVLTFPDRVTGTIYNNKQELLFVEYGTGASGMRRPHPKPQAIEYNFRVYDHYNPDYVGQESQHKFFNRVEAMKRKMKKLNLEEFGG